MNKDEFLYLVEEKLKNITDDPRLAPLGEALKYAVLGGGKRIRPYAVLLGADSAGGCAPEQLVTLAAAIEAIHAYSLVHDDLPAMDNDDYRRGKPTLHRKFGEAHAILAGDALLTLAAFVLSEGAAKFGKRFSKAASRIFSGALEMASGQVYDISGVDTEESFLEMYALKTGALIEAAFTAGSIAGGGGDNCVRAVSEYALHLGLAFQLTDDLLDASENSIISVIGENRTAFLAERETTAAENAAESLPNGAELKNFADMLLNRNA